MCDACRKADFSDLIVLNETRGMPDALIVSHLPFGPTAYFTLSNCVLRHDIPECTPASQAHPHLIIDGLNSGVGKRIARILQALYPIPRPESKRVITLANRADFISFRHHMFAKDKAKNKGKCAISEAGPRFEMQVQIAYSPTNLRTRREGCRCSALFNLSPTVSSLLIFCCLRGSPTKSA